MLRFHFITCADLGIAMARELANAREWRSKLTETKARTEKAIASSRELMSEVDAMLFASTAASGIRGRPSRADA
jgi:hypothetical protein